MRHIIRTDSFSVLFHRNEELNNVPYIHLLIRSDTYSEIRIRVQCRCKGFAGRTEICAATKIYVIRSGAVGELLRLCLSHGREKAVSRAVGAGGGDRDVGWVGC